MYDAQLPPVSNRADWIETIELVSEDSEEIITDLSDITMVIEVRDRDRSRCLSGTTEDGHITFMGFGVIQWRFTREEMTQLCAGTYEIGITVKRDGITEQELVGSVPVIDGVVRR
ncbi:hypothetical protein MRBLRH13_000260 [Agrobacterium radiobacter]|uniref:hypothetical protein n=1 Tax=Agrobacterium radiobacter TaxID=362 RepID=UPI00341FD510